MKAHADDQAVDSFAAAMKAKMADARSKGRGGWENHEQCTAEDLSRMLRDHVEKGDPRDVANFCMMLWNRKEGIAATGKQQVGEDCTAILSARIAFEVELCGSLQRAAKELGIDVGYLSRLARGEKTNPSDEVLEKFGLERTVTYTAIKREYVASPLHPRTKSA